MIVRLAPRRSGPAAKWIWHRAFIIWRTVHFENETGRFGIRVETVLRRWSPSRRRWIYLRDTAEHAALIGSASMPADVLGMAA